MTVHYPLKLHNKIFLLVVIAILYFLTGKLGLLTAIPGTNVTPIWPPSGIALAAGLLYGYRVWPAIFVGSFVNNLITLWGYHTQHSDLTIYTCCTFIGIGAALQMLLGVYLINTFIKNDNSLSTVRGVCLFLLFGMISCLVNSLVGVVTLYALNFVPFEETLVAWWTWWLGDATGVFVFTPLILSWFRKPLIHWPWPVIAEAAALLTLTALLGFILLQGEYPIIYTLIPILVWAAFRFRQSGAGFVVLITSGIALWGATHQAPSFAGKSLNESLLLLQSFIAITTAMTYVLAAAVSERFKALTELEQLNKELELKVEERTRELAESLEQVKAMQKQVVTQEKLASLGSLTAGIAHEIKNPLNFINNFSELCLKLSNKINAFIDEQKEKMDPEKFTAYTKNVTTLNDNLSKINQYGKRADNIVKGMLEHSRGESGVFQLNDVNALIEEDLKLAYHAKRAQDSSFNVEIKSSLDPSIGLVEIVPQDISRVLLNLFNNAFYALQEKKKSMKSSDFHPLLTVETKNSDGRFIILVKDNGTGIPLNLREKVFNPFFTTKPPGEGTGLGLSLSYDIVTGEHRGTIQLDSEEGAYTLFTVSIPKSKIGIAKPKEGLK